MGNPFSSQRRSDDGSYDPSKFTLKMGTSKTTKYKEQSYDAIPEGTKPILVCCTDDGKMEMKNGKVFNTGNHPVEMLSPMLHMRKAGFTFDIATTTGEAAVLEMWAYPTLDNNIKELHDSIREMMENPKKISDIPSLDDYTAIFIPGGHGAMINLPSNAALGNLLHQAHENGIPTVTLCHGPAALLASKAEGTGKEFAYSGYEIMCFTDKTDKMTPSVGYLPGHMPWSCQATLEAEGITVLNKKETGATTQDRELITGDSPDAAENLGRFATPFLVKYANGDSSWMNADGAAQETKE